MDNWLPPPKECMLVKQQQPSGSTISCSGYSVGSIGGCGATDANTIYNSGSDGQVSCVEWIDFGNGGSFYVSTWDCAAQV